MSGRARVGWIARRIVYSLVMCAIIFSVVGRAAKWLAYRGWIELDTLDSSIRYLSSAPFVVDGAQYVTNPLVRNVQIPVAFRAVKRDAWRIFVLGESFAMGTPYVAQNRPEPGEGGVSSWLSADLAALFPEHPIEIVNAAAAGQNSFRVRRIAEQVLQLEPDALLVAVCNNEGVLPPGRIDEILHKTGGYRLLAKLVLPDVQLEKRPYFTPQDPDIDAIREFFQSNLHSILTAAHARNVPVLLCTMPVNLRYAGGETGAGHLQDDGDKRYGDLEPNECTKRGQARLDDGDAPGAIDLLRECEDLEALRALGLAYFSMEKYEEARVVLSQYAELVPRNRCRPSLNRIIREEAAAAPWVHLVDFEAAAEALSPGGVPGPELFFDYCHMNWVGYAAMADVVRKTMQEAGIEPPGPAQMDRLPSRPVLAKQFGLPDLRGFSNSYR